jgi:simple sugar transport system ATP-binding protein
MDEPTAALGVKETTLAHQLIRKLRRDDRTVLLVSHDMRQIMALADRVVIPAAGRKYVDRPVAGFTAEILGQMIVSEEDCRSASPPPEKASDRAQFRLCRQALWPDE